MKKQALVIILSAMTFSHGAWAEAISLWDDEPTTSQSDSLWDDDIDNSQSIAEPSPWRTTKFVELGVGAFTQNNRVDSDFSLGEVRGQFGANRYFGNHFFNSQIELIGDGVADKALQANIRELYMDFKLRDNMSLRVGQQVLTWGTGDFLFLNDVFAKDWQAMLSGRDDSYLKKSEPAIKFTWFNPKATLDVVWIPVFQGDEIISGERFSYYNPMAGGIVSQPRVQVQKPDEKLKNGQFATRLSTTHNGIEYAAYAHHGYYTQPSAFNMTTGRNEFPRMNSLGASIRSPFLGGIANAEIAYWNFLDDKDGRNPLIPKDQWNLLLGYEKEIATNVTLGGQWQIQKMQHYDNAVSVAPNPSAMVDEYHHTLTARLTWLAMQQKLTTSIFAFYSPDSQDFYLKPKVGYRQDDNWYYEVGANLFGGKHDHSQWGQFTDNSNIYARIRYNF